MRVSMISPHRFRLPAQAAQYYNKCRSLRSMCRGSSYRSRKHAFSAWRRAARRPPPRQLVGAWRVARCAAIAARCVAFQAWSRVVEDLATQQLACFRAFHRWRGHVIAEVGYTNFADGKDGNSPVAINQLGTPPSSGAPPWPTTKRALSAALAVWRRNAGLEPSRAYQDQQGSLRRVWGQPRI